MNLSLNITLLLILFSLNHFTFSQEINSDVKKILLNIFGENSNLSYSKYNIDKNVKELIEKKVNQKFHSNFIYLYTIKIDNKITGYAILDNVFGKSLPITFLVLFDKDGNILASHIIKYREPYGGAVKNENWNRQFLGKNWQSTFEVGKDVSSISGATISVNSVAKGIHKLTLLIKEIIFNNE